MSEDDLAAIVKRHRQAGVPPAMLIDTAWRTAYHQDVGLLLKQLRGQA